MKDSSNAFFRFLSSIKDEILRLLVRRQATICALIFMWPGATIAEPFDRQPYIDYVYALANNHFSPGSLEQITQWAIARLPEPERLMVQEYEVLTVDYGPYPVVTTSKAINLPPVYLRSIYRRSFDLLLAPRILSNAVESGDAPLIECAIEILGTEGLYDPQFKFKLCDDKLLQKYIDIFRDIGLNKQALEEFLAQVQFSTNLATAFALLHEFGHVTLSHLEADERSNEALELEADYFAWKRIGKLPNETTLIVFVSFLSKPFFVVEGEAFNNDDPPVQQKTHPADGCRALALIDAFASPELETPLEYFPLEVIGELAATLGNDPEQEIASFSEGLSSQRIMIEELFPCNER